MSESVRVEKLVKAFGDFTAVNEVSFSVASGEIFGFLGSNGAGKTTTIRVLCGLLRPTSGNAWVQGLDVYTQAEEIRQTIGYMSQKFSLYDELTVGENIDFFSGVYSVPRQLRRERKEEILELLQLQERRQTTTGLLPGGWKQRLALGCAILHRPPVLFLDEPTSGVDPIARRGFWELIYRLSEAGHTIFVTTHYMDEAEYCHRLALMHAGRMVALGSPQQLRGDFPAGLLQLDVPDILKAMLALEKEPAVQDAAVFGKGLHLLVADPDRDASRVRQALQQAGIEVLRLEAIAASMEDVFVTLIERRGQG